MQLIKRFHPVFVERKDWWIDDDNDGEVEG